MSISMWHQNSVVIRRIPLWTKNLFNGIGFVVPCELSDWSTCVEIKIEFKNSFWDSPTTLMKNLGINFWENSIRTIHWVNIYKDNLNDIGYKNKIHYFDITKQNNIPLLTHARLLDLPRRMMRPDKRHMAKQLPEYHGNSYSLIK